MGFTYVQLGDNDPVKVSDDESVVAVFEARGFKQVDDPTVPGTADTSVQAAEVDDRGQGWVNLQHADTGGTGRFPVEVVEQLRTEGWELPAVLEAAAAKKKPAKKASPEPVGDDTKEK